MWATYKTRRTSYFPPWDLCVYDDNEKKARGECMYKCLQNKLKETRFVLHFPSSVGGVGALTCDDRTAFNPLSVSDECTLS